MSDVLSQSEIDALLHKFDSGDLDLLTAPTDETNKVREYDFRTANRFHKEQMRTLNVVFDNFARLFASYLSGTLRVMCSAEVKRLEEMKYQEFVNALPSPVILAIMRQPPLIGPILFVLSPDISYAMISRLLGGAPLSAGNEFSREFTEIELVLMERMLRQFMPLFVESWEKIDKISVQLDRIETSPQFAQIVAANETVAIVSLSVNIAGAVGLVNICLPQLALEPVSDKLSTRTMYQVTETQRCEESQQEIAGRLRNTPLFVTAAFNSTQATVRDILNLAVGDVLQLEHTLEDPMTLMVGHLPKFHGALGTKENRYAIKISEVINKEDVNE